MVKKVILLIGASGGIGTHLIKNFGVSKFIIAQHYYKSAIEISKYQANITDYQEVERMVDLVINDYGKIDILINCAGKNIDSFTHKFITDDWKAVIDVNLVGAFNTIRAVLPHMREAKYGRIINISSVVGQKAVMGTSAYSASKSGLDGLARTVSDENIKFGITCNNIALGYFNAGMTYDLHPDVIKEIIQSIPANRLGYVKELFYAIDFIIKTGYYTGQTLNLNGGLN